MAAISQPAQNQFENDAGVEYPEGRFGHVSVPFEKLLDWVATGRA
jgi:hypothetical protein